MTIDTNALCPELSRTDAKQNFSSATKIVDQKGTSGHFQNGSPIIKKSRNAHNCTLERVVIGKAPHTGEREILKSILPPLCCCKTKYIAVPAVGVFYTAYGGAAELFNYLSLYGIFNSFTILVAKRWR